MLAWVIQMILVSLVFIFIIHHLIHFFKSTLTVPRIKDLVNNPNKKYEDIYNVISNTSSEQTTLNKKQFSYSESDLLPKNEMDMKNELKSFLKKQFNQPANEQSSTEISMLDSSNGSGPMYSSF